MRSATLSEEGKWCELNYSEFTISLTRIRTILFSGTFKIVRKFEKFRANSTRIPFEFRLNLSEFHKKNIPQQLL